MNLFLSPFYPFTKSSSMCRVLLRRGRSWHFTTYHLQHLATLSLFPAPHSNFEFYSHKLYLTPFPVLFFSSIGYVSVKFSNHGFLTMCSRNFLSVFLFLNISELFSFFLTRLHLITQNSIEFSYFCRTTFLSLQTEDTELLCRQSSLR